MKKAMSILLTLCMVMALCAGAFADGEEIVRGGTLKVGKGVMLSTMNPTKFTARDSDYDVYCQIYETLIKSDVNGNLVPGLAESWEVVDDTAVSFKLREDVKFHDGSAFNAEAVKANFDYFMDPEVGCVFISELKNIESVNVVDEYTVEIKLVQPSSLFLTDLTNYAGIMVAPSALEQGADYLAANACGTGPFKVTNYVEGVSVTLEPNEYYYINGVDGKPLPYLDKVEISMITDQTTKVNSLMAGDVDCTDYLTTTGIETLEANSAINIQRIATSDIYCLFCNVQDDVLGNLNVRQAIAYAVDRDILANVITRGYGFASNWACDPGQWFYDAETPYGTNIEKAKELLAEAGYGDGLTISMSCISREPDNTVMQILQQQLAQIGITLNLESMERTEWVSLWTTEHTGELGLAKMTVPRVDAYVQLYTNMGAGAANNYSTFTGEEFNTLLDKLSTVYDTEEQKAILQEAQAVYLADCASIFLYQMPRYDAYADYVKGFSTLTLGACDYSTFWLAK